jgi:type IV pilus assembly protein PilB
VEEKRQRVIPATKGYYSNLIRTKGPWVETPIKDMDIPPEILNLLDKEVIEKYQIIPVGIEKDAERELVVLVSNLVTNLQETAKFEELLGKPVIIKLAELGNLQEGIRYHCNLKTNFLESKEFQDVDDEATDKVAEISSQEKTELYRMVENILHTAIEKGATDIHLKPGENKMYVVLKIDGHLVNFTNHFPIRENQKEHVVNIIKGFCPTMDTSNYISPEDGSFIRKWGKNQKSIFFRVASLRTIYGQKVGIRLLDGEKVPLSLDELHFSEEERRDIKKILMRPSGLFFVTGPVNSGKSTTIHAALEPFKTLTHNCITIENPVEYRDEFLTQTQVHEAQDEKRNVDARMIFKNLLRQDPNTIFLTETRDAEDAAMLVTAALSGHRILTTMHTDDALSGIDRLRDMKVDQTAFKKVNGIMSQRLLALNCPDCMEQYVPEGDELLLLSEEDIRYIKAGKPMRSRGCSHCNDGIRGMQVICEIIIFDNELRDFLFMGNHGTNEIYDYLKKEKGFVPMWNKGLDLVRAGKVTLAELNRVLAPTI